METATVRYTYLNRLQSTESLRKLSDTLGNEEYIFFTGKSSSIPDSSVRRLLSIAYDTRAVLLYSDYRVSRNGILENNPLCDWQRGSLRDDFDFGEAILIRADAYRSAVADMSQDYKYAAFYDLRLRLSEMGEIIHVNEFLYTVCPEEGSSSEKQQFAYVDPKNRDVQIEMEIACTQYLKRCGAYIQQEKLRSCDVTGCHSKFPVEASVVIPVYNRSTTIADAIRSAMCQKTDFDYNIIVVDNYSDDGTSGIIDSIAEGNHYSGEARCRAILHLVPEERGHGIGGCWNLAVDNPSCGRYAVQLDSDDLYSGPDTLQKIVDKFREEKCAMVIGSYEMKDFSLNTLAPGVIDHREWTDSNGMNNILRVNGAGAPRAFYTPVIRAVRFPDTSYGEDYSAVLRITRRYRIGRIYDVLYYCRRWSGNSDSNPGIIRLNAFNTYKDRLRTWELSARIFNDK